MRAIQRYLSPQYGVRGWLGILLLGLLFAILIGAQPTSFWVQMLLWFLILMGPVELLRTDAIEQRDRD